MKIELKDSIKTDRLILKPFSASDRERLSEFMMNDEITDTFMVPILKTKKEYLDLADKIIKLGDPAEYARLQYGVFLESNLIGFINDCGFNDEEIEIGYVIHPDFKGMGYATEAVKAVIDELWAMGFKKIIASYFEGNEGSRRVMEKSGFEFSGRICREEYRNKTFNCYYCEIKNPLKK